MPLYYFHVFDDRVALDIEGVDLPDHASALRQAARLSGELLQDGTAQTAVGNAWRMEVTDETGRTVHRIDVRIAPLSRGD